MWLVTLSFFGEKKNAFENASYLGSHLLDAIAEKTIAKWSMDEEDHFIQG